MTMMTAYKAYAPASSANLSVGFDLLGIALRPLDGSSLGDFVTVRELRDDEPADINGKVNLRCTGRFADRLPPEPEENIVYNAYLKYESCLQAFGRQPKRLELTLEKNLPICSGLGSSAASAVAAVYAIDAAHDYFLPTERRIELMGLLEGGVSGSVHYDNVAPCYFGGMQFIVGETSGASKISESIPYFDNWYWVMCFPGIKVSTAAARSILPVSYARQDVVTYGRRIGTFVHASYVKNEDLACSCLIDVMAEPYRAALIPMFNEARAYGMSNGAIATGISGSGSSIFSIFKDLESAKRMQIYLQSSFIANEDGFCHICKIDPQGSTVEKILLEV